MSFNGSFLARKARAITPSDTLDVEPRIDGFFVAVAGNVSVIMINDDAPTLFTGCQAGTVYPFSCKRIRATGTTATGIVALSS